MRQTPKWHWNDGPRACTLIGHGGAYILAQISLDDNGRWNVYNFPLKDREVASGGYSTEAMAKAVAENVVKQIERNEQPENQVPEA